MLATFLVADVETAERSPQLAAESYLAIGAAPNGRGGGNPAAAVELSAVYRFAPELAVAASGGFWWTGGSCNDTEDPCEFARWWRVAPELRWYPLRGAHGELSILGETGAIFAKGFAGSPIVGAGLRGELLSSFGGVIGLEIRSGAAIWAPRFDERKPTEYFFFGLSAGFRFGL